MPDWWQQLDADFRLVVSACAIVIVLLTVVVCGCEREEKQRPEHAAGVPNTRLWCIKGYTFAVYDDRFHAGGITQVFENTPNGIRALECRAELEGQTWAN